LAEELWRFSNAKIFMGSAWENQVIVEGFDRAMDLEKDSECGFCSSRF
jgi:hypothetical protein